jgi:internalin A
LYLLVLNGREGGEDDDAAYWMKHIETFGGDSPVVVVQNKIEQHPFELNYRGLQSRYPQIRGFVKTDCREDFGLDALEKKIRDTIDLMPEVRILIPST